MKLLLLCALVGCLVVLTVASEDHKCGPLAKIKVRRQWDKAYGEGSHRLDFGIHFWHHLFKDHPKARETFKKFRADNIYSPEFQAHSSRLLGAFGMLIESTDDPEALKVLIQNVKTVNAEKGVDAELYNEIHEEFLETIPEYLGAHFDYDAWNDCLHDLTAALK
jgi:hemoglobin-like flavoprotein